MDVTSISILLGLSALTGAMLLYVHRFLPAHLERRTRDSFRAFSRAVELRFPSHDGLTDEVLELSGKLGRRIGLNRTRLLRLEMAAQLRDIGLCAIPYRLVNEKPVLRWSEEDKDAYYKHQEISATMLELVPSLRHLAPVVRCHHTNYDGSDGPLFPAMEDIPVEARILKIVVSYVWANRWQGGMLARTWLEQGAGTEYDATLVDAFLGVLTSSRAAQPVSLAALAR